MSLEIHYVDVPVGVDDSTSVTATGQNTISNPDAVRNGINNAYATLEPGVWRLDGSLDIMPDDPVVALWSDQRSGDDGILPTPLKVELVFSTPLTATGITLTFSPGTNQWCSEMNAKWYNGQTLLAGGKCYPASPSWVLENTVEGFDRIVLEFTKTNVAGHFAKVQKIEIGQRIVFDATEISKVTLLNEIDPTLCELTADSMTTTIVNRRGRKLIPQENQQMQLYRDGSLVASQYIKNSTRRAGNVYEISCQSAIGILEDTFLGGLYHGKLLKDLIGEILPGWTVEIHKTFSSATVSGYIPVCSQRSALQQVAFAVGAVIKTNGSTGIRLEPVAESVSGSFSANRIFTGASLKTSPRVAVVEVTSHSYSPGEEESTLIRETEIHGENVLYTFSNPYHSYQITGGTILSYGDNWARITADGVVTLTAKNYVHSTAIRTKENPLATLREKSNRITVDNATLVHDGNVDNVLRRLYASSQYRNLLKQDVVMSGQNIGDMVASISPWNTRVLGYLSAVKSTYTQTGHTASVEILGIEIDSVSVYLYSGEIRSGDTEVLY